MAALFEPHANGAKSDRQLKSDVTCKLNLFDRLSGLGNVRNESFGITGFHVRLLETASRPSNLAITAFRAAKSAATVDFLGNTLGDLKTDDGKIKLDLSAHEWSELVARW